MNKLYIFVFLSILLTACGGGGSESSTAEPAVVGTDSPPSNIVSAPIQSQPTVTEFSLEESKPLELKSVIKSTAKTSSEIAVPDGFTLSSERSFNLLITRSKDDNQLAYLSLCSDYQKLSDGSYSINYDSCLLRTSLNDSQYEAVITVTNDTVGLVAAMWFMDESKEPLITDWRF
ncbi:MAG: hypothetical protein ACJAXJ_000476 [Colwellia sp.]|jgi:hypothetical protein